MPCSGDSVAYVDAADVQHAVAALGADRPDPRVEGVEVLRRRSERMRGGDAVTVQRTGGMGAHYIRSGAVTPSRPSPLASTMRVASTSHSRARVRSVAGSSPIGSTRQAS